MKSRHCCLVLALLSAFQGAQAATIDLTGKGWVTYGDANSYSMPLSGLEVMAGPGQIDQYVKLGLNPSGQLGNAQPGMDDAFQTPTANIVEGFRTGIVNEPGGGSAEGSWDIVGWWDATFAALNAKLDLLANSLVFFFANNETGAPGSDNLAGWARIELSQISSNTLLGRFDLTNDTAHDGQGYGPPPAGGGVPLGNPANYTSNGAEPFVSDFAMSGGDVCVNGVGLPVDCGDPGAGTPVQHNLGGDRAAYAVVFPEMDALIAGIISNPLSDLSDFALHVNYRLGCGFEMAGFPEVQQGGNTLCDPTYALNGGDEKLFLGTQLLPGNPNPPNVPEPATLGLLLLGMLGLASLRARASTSPARAA